MNTLAPAPEQHSFLNEQGVIGLDNDEKRAFQEIVDNFDAPLAGAGSEADKIPVAENSATVEAQSLSELRLRSKMGRLATRALEGLHSAVTGTRVDIQSPVELPIAASFDEIAPPRHTAARTNEALPAGIIEKDQARFSKRMRRFGSVVINKVFGIPSSDSEYYRQNGAERQKFEE